MTKTGHLLIGSCLALVAWHESNSIPLATGILVGSNAPDYMELSYWNAYKKAFDRVIPHRTITHYPYLWVGLLLAIYHYHVLISSMISPYIFLFAVGFVIGGIGHLFSDIGTPSGIPLLTPFGKRFSLHLYRTGGGEWRIIIPMSFFTIYLVAPEVLKTILMRV